MSASRFRGVLLCEDQEHERFFRRLLGKWFGKGKLRVHKIPNREGAGDAYVTANYAREVQLARRWRSENYALVVAIDGDRGKLQGRMDQLDRELDAAGLARRSDGELIVLFIPTRNIETWQLWLCGARDLDEERNYKPQHRDAERRGEVSPKLAAQRWFETLSENEKQLEKETLPSLSAARDEIRRLEI